MTSKRLRAPKPRACPEVPEADAIGQMLYRRCVGLMLLNRDGKVLVAQRNDVQGEAWQMPQGGIDKEESPRAAAMRELKEELGIGNAEIIAESRDWLRYDLPLEITPKVWDGRFRGQEQKWFVLRFLGDDGEIDLDCEGAEFSAWKWVDVACLPDLIIWFKRPIYLELVKRFSELAKPVFDLE